MWVSLLCIFLVILLLLIDRIDIDIKMLDKFGITLSSTLFSLELSKNGNNIKADDKVRTKRKRLGFFVRLNALRRSAGFLISKCEAVCYPSDNASPTPSRALLYTSILAFLRLYAADLKIVEDATENASRTDFRISITLFFLFISLAIYLYYLCKAKIKEMVKYV